MNLERRSLSRALFDFPSRAALERYGCAFPLYMEGLGDHQLDKLDHLDLRQLDRDDPHLRQMLQRVDPCKRRSSAHERAAVANLQIRFLEELRHGSHSFSTGLCRVHRCILPDGGQFRRGDAFLSATSDKMFIKFPSPAVIQKRLEDLRRWIIGHWSICPFAVATITYVALLNLHPYSDGNGRLSRAVFNFLALPAGSLESRYMPIAELARICEGDVELAIRRAEILGDFDRLLSLFYSADRLLNS